MFAGCVGGERPLALGAVDLAEDDLVVGISNLDMHSNPRTRRHESVCSRIVQLDFVITCNIECFSVCSQQLLSRFFTCDHGFVGDFFDKTLSLCLANVEVQPRGERQHDDQGKGHDGGQVLPHHALKFKRLPKILVMGPG